MRVPVLSVDGKPLMPAKPSRVRRWLKSGLAKVVKNDLNLFCVQLNKQSGSKTQPIAIGIDPGKLFTGVGVQSAKFTLLSAHLILPFKTVKERMEVRRMMRRNRRGRRINRKISFNKRAHRQKRFNNRRGHKIPPSIKANRQLELRVVKEIASIYPVTSAVYEVVKAKGSNGFSPVMVGQRWMIGQLEQITSVLTKEGWETSNMREHLGLVKQKHSKGDTIPATHAVDGIALASSQFTEYRKWYGDNVRGAKWFGSVQLTRAPFMVIRRPPICRRQLHLMLPAHIGIRRKYGGTTTRHRSLRKGDYVRAEQAGRIYCGWVSGDTERQVSVSDINWKRLGQFTAKKVRLVQRSNGLLVEPQGYFQAG